MPIYLSVFAYYGKQTCFFLTKELETERTVKVAVDDKYGFFRKALLSFLKEKKMTMKLVHEN